MGNITLTVFSIEIRQQVFSVGSSNNRDVLCLESQKQACVLLSNHLCTQATLEKKPIRMRIFAA